MLRQIRLLSRVQLCNLFGINEVRYTKDRDKRGRFFLMSALWVLLILMMLFYMVIAENAFIKLGMADVIPVYLMVVTSVIILVFTFLKAGSVIFQMNSFELMVSLPVSGSAIVVSRFLTMYVTNLMLSILVMVPGIVIYGSNVQPPFTFYVYSITGMILIPLLPITVATAIGALITAVSARMKHKSIVAALLSILFAVGIMVAMTALGGSTEQWNEAMLQNMAEVLTEKIERIYPPSVWFTNAAVGGSLIDFLLFAGISIVVFVVVIAVLQRYFLRICSALNATSAKNNYKMQSLKTNSVTASLWRRELKRYFASSIYVSNTIIGYILMAVASVALLIVGVDKMNALFVNLPGAFSTMLPFLLSFMAVIAPITSCSISMEGKYWWMVQSLPIRSRDVFNGKILANLTIACPFYVISVILSWIAVKPSVWGGVWIALVPAAYILFSSVLGITLNRLMPIFDWENETRVVKQSASVMVAMLIGMVSILPPSICAMFMGKSLMNVISAYTVIILLVLTALLYRSNNKVDLMKIGA